MRTCEICGGLVPSGTTIKICSFCNKIGDSASTSEDSLDYHICGCDTSDRRNCPWCKKPCHHDTSLNPKILISPM